MAIAEFTQEIEDNPNTTSPYIKRGLAYKTNDEYEKAIVDFSTAIEMGDDSAYMGRAVAYMALGDSFARRERNVLYKDQGEYAKAVADLTRFIDKYPLSLHAFYQLCELYIRLMQYKNVDANEERIKGLKNRGASYKDIGNVSISEGRYEAAIYDFNDALELCQNEENFCGRGRAYFLKGDLDRAISDFSKFIDINIANCQGFALRGLVFSAQGQYYKAISDFTTAIILGARNIYRDRAYAYSQLGEKQKASMDYNEFIKFPFTIGRWDPCNYSLNRTNSH